MNDKIGEIHVNKFVIISFLLFFMFLISIKLISIFCYFENIPSWSKIYSCGSVINLKSVLKGSDSRYWRLFFERGIGYAELDNNHKAFVDFQKSMKILIRKNSINERDLIFNNLKVSKYSEYKIIFNRVSNHKRKLNLIKIWENVLKKQNN